jgi:hypothetical protein
MNDTKVDTSREAVERLAVRRYFTSGGFGFSLV